MTEWTLTGRHVLAITVSAFAVIIGVNIYMATEAVRTFPGLEVKNSYVASQEFNKNLKAQTALHWDVASFVEDDKLILSINDANGLPVMVNDIEATFGRPTSVRDDQTPEFKWANGRYEAPIKIAPGNWNLRLRAKAADGTLFQQRIVVLHQ